MPELKSRPDGARITLSVMEPVEAELLLVTPRQKRPPTEKEMDRIGYLHRNWLYARMKEMLRAVSGPADEETPTRATLRYFCEYLVVYQHEVPEGAIDGMRRMLNDAQSVGLARAPLREAIAQGLDRMANNEPGEHVCAETLRDAAARVRGKEWG